MNFCRIFTICPAPDMANVQVHVCARKMDVSTLVANKELMARAINSCDARLPSGSNTGATLRKSAHDGEYLILGPKTWWSTLVGFAGAKLEEHGV